MNLMLTEAYSEPCQTSKMELFEKKVNSFQPLTIFARILFLDVWLGSGYTSGKINDEQW